jgi:ABC-2 type transport system permease protein
MTAFANHFAFEFKSGLRNTTSLLMNYLFPLGFFALMGFVFPQINPPFREVLIPALLIFSAMASNLLGLPGPLVESREAGIYRSFKINGVPAVSILLIPALTTIIHTLIVSVIITAIAIPLFDAGRPTNWVAFALITLLTVVTLGAIGALIGVISSGSRSTVLWSQLVFLPSMLLGGLMMPLEFLPEAMRPVASLLPAAHAMQAFSGLAFGKETIFDPWFSVGILAASAVISFGLAIYLFNWDSQNSSRRGHPLLALLALAPYLVGMLVVV